MLKGINNLVFIIIFNSLPVASYEKQQTFNQIQNISIKKIRKKNKKSYKNIKKLCNKTKRKILVLESQGRTKSTNKIQRCKRAYSELRYQACHLKKYNQRKIDSAKSCAR